MMLTSFWAEEAEREADGQSLSQVRETLCDPHGLHRSRLPPPSLSPGAEESARTHVH